MLYLVECQKEGTEKHKYLSLFPEGIEAESGKVAIEFAVSSLGGMNRDGKVTVSGSSYFDFRAKPKKWSSYKTPMTGKDKNDAFEHDIMEELEKKGFIPDPVFRGVRVKTGVDTWIIEVKEAHDADAQITLHHKNNWSANNDGNGSIPGFHEQIRGRFTIEGIINFMLHHEQKWKGRTPHRKENAICRQKIS